MMILLKLPNISVRNGDDNIIDKDISIIKQSDNDYPEKLRKIKIHLKNYGYVEIRKYLKSRLLLLLVQENVVNMGENTQENLHEYYLKMEYVL